MKKTILIAAFLTLVSSTLVYSQESAEDKKYKEKFIEYMNVTKLKETFVSSVTSSIEQGLNNPNIQEEQKNILNEFIDKVKGISQEDLLEIFISPYKLSFSFNELNKLIKFHSSPIGKKFIEKQLQITKEVKINSENYGKKIAEEIMKKYQEEVAKKQEETKELEKKEEATKPKVEAGVKPEGKKK